MNQPAITSAEMVSMVNHGLVRLRPSSPDIPKEPKPKRTAKEKQAYDREYHRQYEKRHPERVKVWRERGRLNEKVKSQKFIAEGLTGEGKVRQRKPYQHWPELAGVSRSEYKRRWMRMYREQTWSNYEI